MKEYIQKRMLNFVDNIFNEIQKAQDRLEEVNSKIFLAGESYLQVSDEIKKLNEHAKLVRGDLIKEKNIFLRKKEQFTIKETKTKEKEEERGQEFRKLVSYIESKKKELNLIKKEIEEISPLKIVKNNLTNDVVKIIEDRKNIEKQLLVLNKEKLSKEIEYNKKIQADENELKRLKSDIEKSKKTVMPKISELDKREKELKEKEHGLRIIEHRYKKLYAEKGANFKI